jgi:hypothetical protein
MIKNRKIVLNLGVGVGVGWARVHPHSHPLLDYSFSLNKVIDLLHKKAAILIIFL